MTAVCCFYRALSCIPRVRLHKDQCTALVTLTLAMRGYSDFNSPSEAQDFRVHRFWRGNLAKLTYCSRSRYLCLNYRGGRYYIFRPSWMRGKRVCDDFADKATMVNRIFRALERAGL